MVPAAAVDAGMVAGGIVLLVAGAWIVVEFGAALAKRWGISPLWIGLMVVALGTSLPELTVTVMAALRASGDLAVSNVVGSNILNILIVLGATAAIAPVPSRGASVQRNVALVAIASVAVWLLAADGVMHRGEGLFLLALVPVYVLHVYREEKRAWVPVPETPDALTRLPPVVHWIALAVGIAILVAGGAVLVEGAQGMARRAGLSDRVIGLTVVAVGTSLPELATSLVAAFRRRIDLALGNLIGSNMLNLLLVLGAAATITSATVSPTLWLVDMSLMIGAALLLMWFAATKRNISRAEGVAMLGVYGVYLAYVLRALVT